MTTRRTYPFQGIKICPRCGAEFPHKLHWSASIWRRTQFCSRTCAAAVVHRTDTKARFEGLYIPEPNSGCWLWLGTQSTASGYGQIKDNGRLIFAHRLSYEMNFGKIPRGLGVLHHCDNRLCVNPSHLYVGTAADNNRDRVTRGRSAIGNRNPSAKLTPEIVRQIRLGSETDTSLARKLEISRPAIRAARISATWKHVK